MKRLQFIKITNFSKRFSFCFLVEIPTKKTHFIFLCQVGVSTGGGSVLLLTLIRVFSVSLMDNFTLLILIRSGER